MTGWDFYRDVWAPAALAVSDMEKHGVALDPARCAEGKKELDEERLPLEERLDNWAGQPINWGSPKQLAQLLYGTEPLPAVQGGQPIQGKGFPVPPVAGGLAAVKLRKEGKEPVSEAALHHLAEHAEDPYAREMLRTMLRRNKLAKLAQFYETLPSFLLNGRVHPRLRPSTETGRLASSKPNLQNVPKRSEEGKLVRAAFVAPPGRKLLALDYDGLEWRILAHVLAYRYQDYSLVEEIVAGVDPHSSTALRVYAALGKPLDCTVDEVKTRYPKEREEGKTLNYSINYGKTDVGLGIQLRDSEGAFVGTEQGRRLLDAFYEARPGVARFHGDIVQYARARGYVRSLLGRYRYINFRGSRFAQEAAERQAKNVIQNCAVDVVTMAMIKCHPEEQPELAKLGVKMVLQVHDELVFEVPAGHVEEAKHVLSHRMETCMEGVKPLLCPLSVSGGWGDNWLETK